jgi:hypothetical protein
MIKAVGLVKINDEVKMIDSFIAVMDFLEAMGYEIDKLTIQEVADIRYDILEVLKGHEG